MDFNVPSTARGQTNWLCRQRSLSPYGTREVTLAVQFALNIFRKQGLFPLQCICVLGQNSADHRTNQFCLAERQQAGKQTDVSSFSLSFLFENLWFMDTFLKRCPRNE